MRPVTIPNHIYEIAESWLFYRERIVLVSKLYPKLRKSGLPDVTIVIPAFNEEKNILATLHSLVTNKTDKKVQILVVNNNSNDNTEIILLETGVEYVNEKKQGITAARNAGLQAALGTYILNADADAIYPPRWIDEMVDPMINNKQVGLTYGRFSFIPVGSTGRAQYFLYEYAADLLRIINKYFKEEAVNVYGFNSGFRRKDGLKVNGFDHPKGANEDGYLALKIRDNGFGKLHYVTTIKALVWTSDRRIQMEGGFMKGLKKRVLKFFRPAAFTQLRTDL